MSRHDLIRRNTQKRVRIAAGQKGGGKYGIRNFRHIRLDVLLARPLAADAKHLAGHLDVDALRI
jgi:hypothetical protein